MRGFRTCLIVLATLLAPAVLSAEETVVVPGAGPSTVVVQAFFDNFAAVPAAQGYSFVVPPRSIKHAGGLKATSDHLFGRTGRPLTEAERGETLREIPLARIPITFVVDPGVGVESLDRDQLVGLLTGRITDWSQVGGLTVPVRLVGREPTEAALMEMSKVLPEMAMAEFAMILKKDHQLVELMGTDDRRGVLGFGASPNFAPDLHLEVEGLEAGLSVGLVHHRRNDHDPLVKAVRAYARDPAWLMKAVDLGYLPAAPNP